MNYNQNIFPSEFTNKGDINRLLTSVNPFFEGEIKEYTDTKFNINPVDNGCGLAENVVNCIVINRRPVLTKENSWTIDVSKTEINKNIYTGGIIDSLGKQNSNWYHLYYFLNDNFLSKGYGLVREPITTASAVSGGNKGSLATYTIPSPQGWAFTIGAKVSVYKSESEWNTGKVYEAIGSSLKILMDNESYGNNITSSDPIIKQYNRFKPVNLAKSQLDSDQTLITSYYLRLKTDIYINSSGNIQFADNPNSGFNIPVWWDKNISATARILHPDYMEMDGSYIINPLSPLVGLQTRDLLSDDRFIRADSTSGTEQDGTEIMMSNVSGGTNRLYVPASSFATPTDTLDDLSAGLSASYLSLDGDTGTVYTGRTRPVNISMVPVVRVVE